MKKIINPIKAEWAMLTKRPTLDTSDLTKLVSDVFSEVEKHGDEAVKSFTKQFDKVTLSTLFVSTQEFTKASALVKDSLKAAIGLAKDNIEKFHRAQVHETSIVETCPGVTCWQEARPIEKIGLYIPGGSAPLFSTVLMLAVPAQIAGCKEIILCTPPDAKGNIHPAILYTAQLAGITKIVKIGGIQAIAALALGTQTIPQVYKIFGPGNQYVTAAKQRAQSLGTAIDIPAGPSELLVVADETANPSFVASDLLSQAEHGADSQVICIVNNEALMNSIQVAITEQLAVLPRYEIASQAIDQSKLILFTNQQDGLDFINYYAPEHLILAVRHLDFYRNGLINAGSVFIGNYSPESAGDYASGTNHTLPTTGFAKAYSGVNLDSFIKKISFQEITPEGIAAIGPAIEKMALAEGLEAHKNAVTLRLKTLNQ